MLKVLNKKMRNTSLQYRFRAAIRLNKGSAENNATVNRFFIVLFSNSRIKVLILAALGQNSVMPVL